MDLASQLRELRAELEALQESHPAPPPQNQDTQVTQLQGLQVDVSALRVQQETLSRELQELQQRFRTRPRGTSAPPQHPQHPTEPQRQADARFLPFALFVLTSTLLILYRYQRQS